MSNYILKVLRTARESLSTRSDLIYYVVMGNESCDLDSAVSSLVYSWFILSNTKSEDAVIIPVLNMNSEDFLIKTEVIYFLKECNVPVSELIFRDQVDLTRWNSEGKLNLILVDHHVLSAQDLHLKKSVRIVLDHRPLDPSCNLPSSILTIQLVGSCSTLIANSILKNSSDLIDFDIAKLVYGTIILDTGCFSESAKRATQLDHDVVNKLRVLHPSLPDRKVLFDEILNAKADISMLTSYQLLHKDLKVILGLPVPVLPMTVREFLNRKDADESLEKFSGSKQSKTVILIGISIKDDEILRDIGIYSKSEEDLEKFCNGLKGSEDPNLELDIIEEFENMSVKLLKQNNLAATRKHILPIIKKIME